MNNVKDLIKKDMFVSVVIACRNQEYALKSKLQKLHEVLDSTYVDFELVIVDNFSEDSTENFITSKLSTLDCIRYIKLSNQVENDIAVSAGLENSIGDFVVLFDILQDPISLIDKAVTKCYQGCDIVIGVAKQNTSFLYNLVRPCTNKLLKMIGYNLPQNATSFRCLSRRAVNSITESGRLHHKMMVRISRTGFPSTIEQYSLESTNIEKSLNEGIRDTIKLMVFNSTKPLRWMSLIGVFGSFLAFLFSSYSFLVKIIGNSVVDGWATLVIFSSILFMLLFTMLAFFGEYLGRLLDDRSEHRDYSVVFEKNSSVMVNETRVNVLNESVTTSMNLVQTGRNK